MVRHDVQLLPLLGSFVGDKGTVDVRWPQIERLILNNREVAKVKTAAGAAVQLYPHIRPTESEKAAIIRHLTEVRGQPPAAVHCTSELFEILDQQAGDDDEETEIDSE